jgi:regulator of protease activity HflC (stomatin/prohibitin superfamily)
MKRKTIIAIILLAILGVAHSFVADLVHPTIAPQLAVNAVSGGNADANALRGYNSTAAAFNWTIDIAFTIIAVWWLATAVPAIVAMFRKTGGKTSLILLGLVPALFLTGCMQAYDKPEFDEIANNETGFLFPLEGDTSNQAKFQSEEFLKQAKVASKRVQITHRWVQDGRMNNDGHYIPTVRLVKVDRSPVTREWKAPEDSNGHALKGAANDTAIWIESGDSVGFSMGFNCTAYVKEEDAAKFLYWYPSGSLAQVMDQEIRARVQANAAEVAAKYGLDILRSKKQEIADQVRQDVTTFFSNRGITITTIGMFGGMTYENPKIQEAIDNVFVAQQEKNTSQATFEAQQKKNDTIQLAAQAEAEKRRIEAKGEADAIKQIQDALTAAQQNPLYVQLKVLETQAKLIEKWNGQYPSYYMGNGNPSLLLQVPNPAMALPAGK